MGLPGLTPARLFPCLKLWVGLGSGSKMLRESLRGPIQEPSNLARAGFRKWKRNQVWCGQRTCAGGFWEDEAAQMMWAGHEARNRATIP